RLLENSLSAKVSCWLIRLLILGSGYNTMISHLGLIRTFLKGKTPSYFSKLYFQSDYPQTYLSDSKMICLA
ncbi:hypothetical protein, partial [Klebsiella quasivariicola]|uniref:hypothetical protein n=1 Tax=Klebsiella quasivariicola TaxID=2026240 RepID=UPI003F5A2756